MIVQSRQLAGALRAAVLFASKDITRPALNCVHLEAVAGALRVVATDGHTLWACEIAGDGPDARDVTGKRADVWNMPAEEAERIAKALKKIGKLAAEIDLLGAAINGTPCEHKPTDIFARYADVLRGVTCSEKSGSPPQLAAGYAARACEGLSLYSQGFAPELPAKGAKKWEVQAARDERARYADPGISWRYDGATDPVVFFLPKLPKAIALIMPRRAVGGEGTAAAFLAQLGGAPAPVAGKKRRAS